MSNITKTISKFHRSQDGLVTIEWVGISSVIFLAGFIITAFIMEEAANLGNATADKLSASATALNESNGGGTGTP